MGFGRRKRPSEDEDWAIDDDDWLLLDENGSSPAKPTKAILVVITAVALVALCGGTAWFSRAKYQANVLISELEQSVSPATSLERISPLAATTSTLSTVLPIATLPALSLVSTPIPTLVASGQQLESSVDNYDPDALAAFMLELVNTDRQVNGLSPVAWDTTATLAGQRHSEDMVQNNYFSHWNQEGLGPEHRYAQIGGEYVAMENLHAFSYTYDNGSAAPIEDWQEVIKNAQIGLMNSPGHRANILDPAHTHVGIGMAYNPDTGQFRLAQEFTNQYVTLFLPIPGQALVGDEIVVNGRLSPDTISNILLDIAYEPFPSPMSREVLNQTSTYTSRAESLNTIVIPAEFNEIISLDASGDPGFYHVRIFGDFDTGQALLMDRVIVVR